MINDYKVFSFTKPFLVIQNVRIITVGVSVGIDNKMQ